jgi:hypothetical protein
MNTGTLPPEFQALETRLTEIKSRYQRGEIDNAAYQQLVQSLTCVVGGVTWWLGGKTGAWHRWDGVAWVASAPPQAELADTPALPSGVEPRARRKLPRPLLLGCGAGALLGLIAVLVVVIGGLAEYRAAPKIVEGIEPGVAATATNVLSANQQQVAEAMGAPEAFTLLFYEEELDDGTFDDVRFETWSYYTAGLEYTFINGEQVAEEPLEVAIGGDLVHIPYRPEQFSAYMSLEQVIDAAGLTTYLVVPLEKELVDGGEVYYADELTFGLKKGELLYLEALALEAEG